MRRLHCGVLRIDLNLKSFSRRKSLLALRGCNDEERDELLRLATIRPPIAYKP